MTYWFTADTHFGHRNILTLGSGRPFEDLDEHDEALIRNWNARVGPRDVVYHLGDLSFRNPTRTAEILGRLKGRIHLVHGNHDRMGHLERFREAGLVVSVEKLTDVHVPTDEGHQVVVLCHYPLLTWEGIHHGTWMLHGHCHGTLGPTDQKRMDVGVDCTGFSPISFEEVAAVMATRDGTPPDIG